MITGDNRQITHRASRFRGWWRCIAGLGAKGHPVIAPMNCLKRPHEFGIAHSAEEYTGPFGELNWGDDGQIYTEVLPFFRTHLVFAEQEKGNRK